MVVDPFIRVRQAALPLRLLRHQLVEETHIYLDAMVLEFFHQAAQLETRPVLDVMLFIARPRMVGAMLQPDGPVFRQSMMRMDQIRIPYQYGNDLRPYRHARQEFSDAIIHLSIVKTDSVKKIYIDLLGKKGGEISCGEPLLSITEKE